MLLADTDESSLRVPRRRWPVRWWIFGFMFAFAFIAYVQRQALVSYAAVITTAVVPGARAVSCPIIAPYGLPPWPGLAG